MTIYMSKLATNEQHKAILIHHGLLEEVGYIELGMCPECHKGNMTEIKNKKALEMFHVNGMCTKCQKFADAKIKGKALEALKKLNEEQAALPPTP